MKKILFLALMLLAIDLLQAQQKINVTTGTKLQYSVSVQGQTFLFFIRVDSFSATHLALTWKFEDGRSGRFVATKSSIDSATIGYYNQPIDQEEIRLPGNQLILFLSKSVFDNLTKKGKSEFDAAKIKVKPYSGDTHFSLNGQLIDAIHVESESGAIFWILNSATAPLILKTLNNPAGVDVELMSVE